MNPKTKLYAEALDPLGDEVLNENPQAKESPSGDNEHDPAFSGRMKEINSGFGLNIQKSGTSMSN